MKGKTFYGLMRGGVFEPLLDSRERGLGEDLVAESTGSFH